MKFPYIKIPTNDPRNKWIRRSIIPVTLSVPARAGFLNKSVTVDALIDSGADKCLFHSDLAKEIELKLEEGAQEFFGGIEGGKLATFIHKIQIEIMGMNKRIDVLAGFTDSPAVFAILGQEGFFDAFRVKFERGRNSIEITPSG